MIPFEKEMSPQLQYPHWCLQRHFELGNQCQYKESKTVILIQPHTSPVVELSIDLWIGNYDRAKLTLNVVPVLYVYTEHTISLTGLKALSDL